ncbi:unnamed protein product [Calypogeia fissa]
MEVSVVARRGATLVGYRPSRLNSPAVSFSGAHQQLPAVSVKAPGSFQALTTFSGQRLTRRSGFSGLPRRSKRAVVKAHTAPGPTPGSTPKSPLGAESIIDDISRYVYFKSKQFLAPYLPKDFDALGWLPEPIHAKVHTLELTAVIILREVLHFVIFYVLFTRVDSICKWMNWIYMGQTGRKERHEEFYENSSFQAMTEPLRLLTLVWATTRMAHDIAPLLRLRIGHVTTAKIRSIGLIVAITWFVFKWKALYVGKLVSTYKLDAPRIFAFDKVVSLLVYLLSASFIGEVTGFALGSILAVGGFSGVALGLASKEIVSNFFGGAVLFVTRPFVIGERIKTGHISGYVQDIGFLQTKILSQERVPMVVPNQNFTNQIISNYSRATNRLMEAEFPIRMQDIFHVERITSKVVQFLKSHPDVDANNSTPVCYLKAVNSSNSLLAVTALLRSPGGSVFYKAQQSILVRIAEIIISEGASMGSNAQFGVTIPEVGSPEVIKTN